MSKERVLVVLEAFGFLRSNPEYWEKDTGPQIMIPSCSISSLKASAPAPNPRSLVFEFRGKFLPLGGAGIARVYELQEEEKQ